MVNDKFDLTVDDLIVEYLIYKVKNGYDTYFTVREFNNFLDYFDRNMGYIGRIDDIEIIIKNFFKKKGYLDWKYRDILSNKDIYKPHMDLYYNKDIDDYAVYANYRLSSYDERIINTYFMDDGCSRYNDFRGKRFKIREIISKYLEDYPKRVYDIGILNEIDKKVGIIISDIIIEDINSDSLSLYRELVNRISYLYHYDKRLIISTSSDSYLALANYNFIKYNYEDIFCDIYSSFNKNIIINLNKNIYTKYDCNCNKKTYNIKKLVRR